MTWGSELRGLWQDLTAPADPDPGGGDLEHLRALLEDGVVRAADGETPALFAPHLTQLAVELGERRAESPPPARDQILQVLGLFHASRWSHLPDGVADDDLELAQRYFVELEVSSPAMVPDAFRTAGSRPPTGGATAPEDLEDVLTEWYVAYQQAERSGNEDDLEASVAIAHRLLACQYEDPDQGAYAALCAALSFSDLGDRGNAAARDADVSAGREAVRRSTAHGEHRIDALARLGNALLDRHRETGSRADLDELIDVSGLHVAACPPDDHENLRIGHGELAECYRMRAEITESVDDLEGTIEQHRLALQHTPVQHDDHPMYLLNLASALVDRGTAAGSLRHLHEAVSLVLPVADAPFERERAYLRHRIVGKVLGALAFEIDDLELTTMALDHHRRAVALSRADEFEGRGARIMLSAALLDGFGRLLPDDLDVESHVPLDSIDTDRVPRDARAWLDEAIAVALAVLDVGAPPDERCLAHGTLALAVRARFLLGGRPSDLDEAVRHAEAALGLDDIRHVSVLSSLATCLRSVYARDGEPAAVRRACACWREITEDETQELDGRQLAALSWTEAALTAHLEPEHALAAAEAAVGLLTRVAAPGTTRADSERRLARWTRVAGDAAVAAVRAGRPERAVELLEQGRAVLWNALLDTRADLQEVRATRPDLADEVVALRATLTDLQSPVERLEEVDHAEARIIAGRHLEAATHRIREAGFDTFGLPLRAPDILRHAHRGQVAIISTTRYGSHAFLVGPAGVDTVDLPELSLDDALTWTGRYLEALDAVHPDEGTLAAAHAWLWRAVARPVLDRIGAVPGARDADLPRLWWCPTGPLSLLPLHAAAGPDGAVVQRVISSYTATVRSLPHSTDPRPIPHEALFVGMNHTPGAAFLEGVAHERESLLEVLPHGAVATLEDERADRRAVTESWTRYPVVHFSGHGGQLSEAPSKGGLLLHDGVLTVAELADLPTTTGRLALLSACQTATGGTVNPDEAITIANALQYGGWDSVVGTLWPVKDRVAT